MKISAIVITKNEEKNIEACLDSVKWADEIIVVDSNSKDNTVTLAKKYTPNVLNTRIEGFSEKRKYSLGIAKNNRVLFIDADERVTAELKDEILSLSDSDETSGYYINRKNYCFGKWMRYSGIYPDYHMRLFDKTKAEVTERIVHEGVKVNGNTLRLNSHLIHYSFTSLSQMTYKINLYSTLEALENFRNNKRISKTGVFTHAASAFLRVFISRKGYKDKLEGFFISFSYAMVNFLSHLKLLKLQGKLQRKQ